MVQALLCFPVYKTILIESNNLVYPSTPNLNKSHFALLNLILLCFFIHPSFSLPQLLMLSVFVYLKYRLRAEKYHILFYKLIVSISQWRSQSLFWEFWKLIESVLRQCLTKCSWSTPTNDYLLPCFLYTGFKSGKEVYPVLFDIILMAV